MRSSTENWVELTTLLECKGKTTLMKFIVEFITMQGYLNMFLSCAPNHNARKVLSSFTGIEAFTIHKLLKIRPDNYEAEMIFSKSDDDGVSNLEACKILIVDEISFVDRDLFNILMDEISDRCLIIGLGNRDQLKPIPQVKQVRCPITGLMKEAEANVGELSPFFTDERFYQLELTEIKRSNSPVTLIGEAIRLEKMFLPERSYVNSDGEGVFVTRRFPDFLQEYFNHVRTPEDFKNNRMVAYTNDDVDILNQRIRETIYQTKDPFVKGEIIVSQEPYIKNLNGSDITVFNNGSYLEIVGFEEKEEYLHQNGEMEIRKFTLLVYELDVFYERVNDKVIDFDVLHPDYKESFKDYVDRYAKYLSKRKQDNQHVDWRPFYELKDGKYIDIKYLPVCTIHKSQGITVDNLFYYVDFVKNMSDKDFARRLSYVAVTRARYNTYMLY